MIIIIIIILLLHMLKTVFITSRVPINKKIWPVYEVIDDETYDEIAVKLCIPIILFWQHTVAWYGTLDDGRGM